MPSKLVVSGLVCVAVLAAGAGCTSAGAAGGSQAAQSPARWQLLRLPRIIARTWHLQSVSCPAARFCMVVGGDPVGAAAAILTGSVWHVLRPVEREGSGVHAIAASDFEGVSCPSTTDCIAVGLGAHGPMSDQNLRPLAEHWNGTRWAILSTAPLMPRAWAQSFPGVSCPSATTYIAAAKIGSDAAGEGADGAAEIWHPGAQRWRTTGLRGATWLIGVSCVSGVHCVAISADAIYARNGAAWARLRVGNLDTNAPSAISCASLTRCVVIAGFWPATSYVLRGRTWSIHAMPLVRGNDWTEFAGLSCPAANSCTAVGWLSAHNQDNTSTPLVEHWTGTSWRTERIAPVPHAADMSLSSVSCPTPTDCVTVGEDVIDDNALAERSS